MYCLHVKVLIKYGGSYPWLKNRLFFQIHYRGRADEAFKLFDEMMRMGLIPDDRVYAALVGSYQNPIAYFISFYR